MPKKSNIHRVSNINKHSDTESEDIKCEDNDNTDQYNNYNDNSSRNSRDNLSKNMNDSSDISDIEDNESIVDAFEYDRKKIRRLPIYFSSLFHNSLHTNL